MAWPPPERFTSVLEPTPFFNNQPKENPMPEITIRNLVVQLLQDDGYDSEDINEFIDKVNRQARPVPAWKRVTETRTVLVTFEITVEFEDIPVDTDMDSDDLWQAVKDENGIRGASSLILADQGDVQSVSMTEAEIV